MTPVRVCPFPAPNLEKCTLLMPSRITEILWLGETAVALKHLLLGLHPLPIILCLEVPGKVGLYLGCLPGWCIQGVSCVVGSLLELWRALGSLRQGVIRVQVRLCRVRYPGMCPGCYRRGPRRLPEVGIRGKSYDLRSPESRGGDVRDEEEDVDTRDNKACSHQHGQGHCRVESPCGAAQGEATRQRAAEAQRGWRRRGVHCAALARPGTRRRWPQVQEPSAAVEAHGALAWQWRARVARQQTWLRG